MVAATVAAGNVSGVPIVTPKGTLVVQPKTGWPEVAATTAAWGFHAVETTGPSNQPGGEANGWPDTYVGRQADMNITDAVFTSTIHQTRTRP